MPRSLLVRRALVSIALIALLLFVASGIRGSLAARKEQPAKAAEIEIRIAVRVAEAKRETFREVLTGYGKARALQRTTVAAEIPGLVVRLATGLEPGVSVEAGQELVWLDDRDRRNQIESMEAQIARNAADRERLEADASSLKQQLAIAEEERALAMRELERVKTLVAREVATTSDLDREQLNVTQRRAAVLRFEGQIATNRAQLVSNAADRRVLDTTLAQARIDLARCVIRAPYDGQVEARHIQRGSRVAAGGALLELVDRARIEIPVPLPASRFGEVAAGARAEIRVPGSEDRSWEGVVARIAPTVNAAERTFLVYIEAEGENAVPPGAFVVANVEGRSYENVFVVPRTSMVGNRLFVAIDGVARGRDPVIRRDLPSVVLCSGGIEEGEAIILTNLEQVAEGSRVATRTDG